MIRKYPVYVKNEDYTVIIERMSFEKSNNIKFYKGVYVPDHYQIHDFDYNVSIEIDLIEEVKIAAKNFERHIELKKKEEEQIEKFLSWDGKL